MKHIYLLFLFLIPVKTLALSVDEKLGLVIDTYDLEPKICSPNSVTESEIREQAIGKIFFESKALSGNNEISCQSCHLDDKALTDGLPLAIGVGGIGEGIERLDSNGILVKRNAFTLFGRGDEEFINFFWDGRVGEYDNSIFSPVGNGYEYGFKSPLAVAAIQPLLARDEFLGVLQHFENNEMLDSIDDAYYQDRFLAANNYFIGIFSEPLSKPASELAGSLREHEVDISNIDLVYIGNSLASFIASLSEDCVSSDWERYLRGELNALTDSQKEGALVFYGQGRCAACHSGSLYSDFKFHSIGTPQGGLGMHMHQQDMGLGSVTFRDVDRYLFRTPPLIRVSETPPYGHNGIFQSLEDIVLYHINPIPYFVENEWHNNRDMYTHGSILSRRDDVLGFISIDSDQEYNSLIDFLRSL